MSTINVERPYGVENMMSILLDNFDLRSLAMTREDEEGPPQTACRRRYPAPIMASRLPVAPQRFLRSYAKDTTLAWCSSSHTSTIVPHHEALGTPNPGVLPCLAHNPLDHPEHLMWRICSGSRATGTESPGCPSASCLGTVSQALGIGRGERAAEAGRLDGAACLGGATTVPDRTSSELPAASDVMGVVKLACRLSTPFT
ncbi:hypothetical protein CEP51_014111 [Fusarium floridanum]|uniref:Uncharacterized protein n=1 Tax=Fusarium floridanum TaxID=1325733 RepID=A0A428PYZ9_9HYPO|nr:hypothetical protein CEP51_014111 [Fusarium floridanum]